MRFVLLVIGAAATSALSVAGVRTMLAPIGQTVQSAPALSGDQSSVKPGDLDPVSAAYDSVARQITSRLGVDASGLPPVQRVVTVGPSSFDISESERYLGGGPVVRTWGWDHHVHHDLPPVRGFVHHDMPPARVVHHDTSPAREFRPVVHYSASGHSAGASHGGGHGRR
jgi:hypothetical protein